MQVIATTPSRHLGARLRRFRRLRGIKQQHVAEILGVAQGSVSRWEAGTHVPSPDVCPQLEQLMAAKSDSSSDRALRRLVESSCIPVHLICDAIHMLLAASASREREWKATAGAFLGNSIWKFATDAIALAEDNLTDYGWFDRAGLDRLRVVTGGNGSQEMRILPSTLEWEQIGLADGAMGRLLGHLP